MKYIAIPAMAHSRGVSSDYVDYKQLLSVLNKRTSTPLLCSPWPPFAPHKSTIAHARSRTSAIYEGGGGGGGVGSTPLVENHLSPPLPCHPSMKIGGRYFDGRLWYRYNYEY